jgi:hypothetical protein
VNSWKSVPCSTGYPKDELRERYRKRGLLHGARRLTMIDCVGEAARVGA